MTAWHLNTWYKDNRYCGRCGAKTVHAHKERMLHCVKCGNMIYPKIAPAIIAAVTHDDKLLLTKYAPDREYQKYALIAGFVEIGETIEETVKREVEEEVGLKIKNLTYYKSQPWGYDSNVLMGYFAELDGDENITMDTKELSKAQWFRRGGLPAHNDGISLTREMIGVFEDKEKYEKIVKNY
ncbi:MAG: NAD(+) diphosphatase [Clostridium sp.]|nr:NAD(+) diphosphatase [Clostridium sp.]